MEDFNAMFGEMALLDLDLTATADSAATTDTFDIDPQRPCCVEDWRSLWETASFPRRHEQNQGLIRQLIYCLIPARPFARGRLPSLLSLAAADPGFATAAAAAACGASAGAGLIGAVGIGRCGRRGMVAIFGDPCGANWRRFR